MTHGVPILKPATPDPFDAGKKLHGVDDAILGRVGPHIRMMVIYHAGPHAEYCCVRSNGKGAHVPVEPWQQEISPAKRAFIRELTIEANRRVAYNGFWVFAWSDVNSPRQIVGLWFDGDGDLHLTWEEDRPWPKMQRFGMDNYLNNLDVSIKIWAERLQGVELRQDQLYKAALGEDPS